MKNTTLCYIEDQGKYLMLHRITKKNDENHDKWIGIGGHFEVGESPFDCVLREIKEETGLTVDAEDCHYRGIVTFVSPEFETEQMHLFSASRFTGEPADCDEGVLEWIERERLLSLPMWEGDRIFLDLLPRALPFFSLKLCYDRDGKLLSHTLRFCDGREPMLVSACLIGCACRYDGRSKPMEKTKLARLKESYLLVPVCPEQLGGLATPRLPCEIKDGRVLRGDGKDLTEAYRQGAQETLRIAEAVGAHISLLKSKSPSCGRGRVYDGAFSGTLTNGNGITAGLLMKNGIKVMTEDEL